MDSSNLKSNPFANLFDNISEIQTFVPPNDSTNVNNNENKIDEVETSNIVSSIDSKSSNINNQIERVFHFTLRSDFVKEDGNGNAINYVFMGDDSNELTLLDKNNIDDVINLVFLY